MQLEMLDAINHTSKYKIMKDDVDIYNAEKHRLPCWKCQVRPACFSEKKATKRAKYLRYTVEFKKPCVDSILAIDIINMANSDLLISSLNEIDDMNISELYQDAKFFFQGTVADFMDGQEVGPTAYAMFIRLKQRCSNKFEDELFGAYWWLGDIFSNYFKEIDYAIDLYSKAINLIPEIQDLLEERGDCFYKKNDYKNALNDYKKALEIDGVYNNYLEDIIEECERMI